VDEMTDAYYNTRVIRRACRVLIGKWER